MGGISGVTQLEGLSRIEALKAVLQFSEATAEPFFSKGRSWFGVANAATTDLGCWSMHLQQGTSPYMSP
uniref:Uncharacterized protein n=1 Tax=Bionectria ochroleuca TaxID=29856 RepID=A0A0B7JQ30_BIOOC